jgi:hypothetical protein
MKAADLPGQSVAIDPGTPVLFDTRRETPHEQGHYIVVRIDRVTEPNGETPALAVWHDADGEYGVEAKRVADHVMSLPPSGRSWLNRAADRITGTKDRS